MLCRIINLVLLEGTSVGYPDQHLHADSSLDLGGYFSTDLISCSDGDISIIVSDTGVTVVW